MTSRSRIGWMRWTNGSTTGSVFAVSSVVPSQIGDRTSYQNTKEWYGVYKSDRSSFHGTCLGSDAPSVPGMA
eukprot:3308966-Rhodomonas_salina.3